MEITVRNAGGIAPLIKHITSEQIEPNETYEFSKESFGVIVEPSLEILVENIGSQGSGGKIVRGNNNPLEFSINLSFPTVSYVIYPSNQSQIFSTETEINLGGNLEETIRELTIIVENRMPVEITMDLSLLDINKNKLCSMTDVPIVLTSGISQKSFKISDPEIIRRFKDTNFAKVEGSFQTKSETYKINKNDYITYKIIANATPNF